MRVLLSTIGSRGEVEPLLALALALRSRGAEVRICAPPDFRDWIASFEIPVVSIGPELRPLTAAKGSRPSFSPEQRRQLARDSVAAQFETVTAAARGCDVVIAGGALQIAARSVCEALRLRYVYA